MNDKNVTQAIYNICAAIMFLCISFLAIFGSIQAKRSADTLDAGLSAMSEQVERSADAVMSYFGDLSEYQKVLQQQATNGTEILSEVLAYAAARGLEEAEILSPTEANAIATEAIDNITQKSERWGKIARAINDGILKEQRRSR